MRNLDCLNRYFELMAGLFERLGNIGLAGLALDRRYRKTEKQSVCHAAFLLVATTKPLDLPAKRTRLREILWATEEKDEAEFACITGKLSRTLGDVQPGIRRGLTTVFVK